jgi:hypothetical protein
MPKAKSGKRVSATKSSSRDRKRCVDNGVSRLSLEDVLRGSSVISDFWCDDSESVEYVNWYKGWIERQKLYETTKRDFKTRVLVIQTNQITRRDVMDRLRVLNQSVYDGPVRCEVGSEEWRNHQLASGSFEDYKYQDGVELESCNVEDWLEELMSSYPGASSEDEDECNDHPVRFNAGREELWIGYEGQDVVLLDDYCKSDRELSPYHLGDLADWPETTVSDARDGVNFNSKMLIIISEVPLENWCVNPRWYEGSDDYYLGTFLGRIDCVIDDRCDRDESVDKLNCFLSTDVVKSKDYFDGKDYCVNREKYDKIKRVGATKEYVYSNCRLCS